MTNITNMSRTVDDVPGTLRAIRTKLNLSQEQLAERLGVAFATVNRWEGGSNRPQRAAIEVIAALAADAAIGDETQAPAGGVTQRRRGRNATQSPSTKPMEQMLWDAACSIRGEKDAGKFKDYLLPLLFLKRLSDVFDDEISRLAEDYGDRTTALEIAEGDHSLLRFYVPREARWAVISGREAFDWPPKERPRDIGEHLTKAVRAVVKHNPSLSGVIDVVDFAAERSGERDVNPAKLRDVVETFSDPRYRLGLADVQPDFLGRAYEYLLRKFAEGSGQSAGEFFTPTEVGFLMAWILRPRPGQECHDYACGSAGLLIKLQLVARELDPTSKVPLQLSGQELQAESYAIAQMNAIIHDMEIDLQRGDTMINPKFRTPDGRIRTHDLAIANPMWNQPLSQDIFSNDPFDRFRISGGITTGKGDWAWLQHTLACLNDQGRAAVVLDTGAVTRGSGSRNEDKERNIRKWFVEQDLIEGVVLLPENLFYNTTAPGIIIVLNRRKADARKDNIILLDASRRFRKGRPKNYLPAEELRSLAEAFNKGEPVVGEVAVITRQQAREGDYNLSPSRWVEQATFAAAPSVRALASQIGELDRRAQELGASLHTLLARYPEDASELFGRGLSGEEQKDTAIGAVPQDWDVVPLGAFVTRAQYGLSLRGQPVGKYPILRMNCQLDGKVVFRDLQFVDLDDRTLSAFRLNDGDLLFNRTNSYELVGRMALYRSQREAVFASYLIRLTLDQGGLLPDFVNYYFNQVSVQTRLRALAGRGVSQANISATKLRDFLVPKPRIEEQRDIIRVLEAVDRKIEVHRHRLSLLDELFRSLRQTLLTGAVRASALDLKALASTSEASA